jgi:ketosteroid isomerase-like protein
LDKDKKPKPTSSPLGSDEPFRDRDQGSAGGDYSEPELAANPDVDDFYRQLQPEMRRPRPGPDAMAAALEAVQRLAAEADAEDAAQGLSAAAGSSSLGSSSLGSSGSCRVCGYRNREGNKFCAMCGLPADGFDGGLDERLPHEFTQGGNVSPSPAAFSPPVSSSSPRREQEPQSRPGTGAPETHHYHHHYHHHYFPAGQEAGAGRPAAQDFREPEKRQMSVLRGESMSRAEAAVRRITQEWVLACNTKHLDDLLDLYVADAMVMRSNYPAVRGAAAVREFFFGALDAGLGEVEVEPIRVEVAGDMAYEAGRCKALVPGAAGKRREERGKYLWVLARQSNGEWKIASDCWSSDLTFGAAESSVPPSAGVKSSAPRK